MESNNGAAAFRATLDIDNFDVSVKSMEERVKRMTSEISRETESMEGSFTAFAENAGKAITALLVGGGMTSLLKSIVQTRGEFQKLEIAFETMLGSTEKADALMKQLVNTAAKTPFDLAGISNAAKQLLAFGLASDQVNDKLVKLGDIAAGLSLDMNSVVERYGRVMVQGKLTSNDMRIMLSQGIPIVKALGDQLGKTQAEIQEMVTKGKISFQEFDQALLSLSSEGGTFYNLMEKQSASLTGKLANLEDAWDSMLNEIGESMQDTAGNAIDFATNLVENYQSIIDILKAVAIAYGGVKAAIILNSVATKSETGIAVIDNTVKQAKMKLLQTEQTLTKGTKQKIEELKKARQAEIETLKAQLSQQELSTLQHQAEAAAIYGLLNSKQKHELANLGLTTSSKDYVEIAKSMMSAEQLVALEQASLTNNTEEYIKTLKSAVSAHKEDLETIDERIDKAKKALKAAEDEVAASADVVEWLSQEKESREKNLQAAIAQGNAVEIQTAQEELNNAETMLNTAKKDLNTASEQRNTAQRNLNTLTTRKETLATTANTTADVANTKAKNLLTIATNKAKIAIKSLWATLRANPLGAVLTLVSLAASAFTLFKKKTDETNSSQQGFERTTAAENSKLKMQFDTLKLTTKGSRLYKEAIDEINRTATEYGKSLLNENATLEDQAEKYRELTAAISETTAEKIKAQYLEKYYSERDTATQDLRSQFEKNIRGSYYVHGYDGQVRDHSSGGVMARIKEIQGMSDEMIDQIFYHLQTAADSMREMTEKEAADAFKSEIDYINRFVAASYASLNDLGLHETGISKEEKIRGIQYLWEDALRSMLSIADETERKISGLADLGVPPTIKSDADRTKLSFEQLGTEIAAVQNQLSILNSMKVAIPYPGQLLQDQKNGTQSIQFAAYYQHQQAIKEYQDYLKKLQEDYAKAEKKRQQTALSEAEKRALEQQRQKRLAAKEAELELQRQQEEAEIAIMKDGFRKQEKQRELEHKQRLDTIGKQAAELSKKRREAGMKGELTADQIAQLRQAGLGDERDFSNLTQDQFRAIMSRVDAENHIHLENAKKTFDEEIEYMREQYELYWTWVGNGLEDEAKVHFADLMKEGESFNAWIESKLQDLRSKQVNGETLTDEEARQLNVLQGIWDTNHGVEDPVAKFNKSLEDMTGNAANLTVKIRLLKEALKQINNDPTLNGEQKQQLRLQLAEQIADAERDDINRFNSTYKMYAQTRRETIEQFTKDIQLAGNNTFQANQVRKQMKETIGDMDEAFLKGIFSEVFNGKATAKAIKAALGNLKAIKEMDLDTFNSTYGQNMSQEEFDQLKEKIDGVASSMKSLQGYNIADAFKDIRDGRVSNDLERVARGTQYLQTTFQNLTSVVSTLSSALNELADATDNENLKNTAKTVESVSNVLSSTGQFASMGASVGGGWGAAIGAILGLSLGAYTEFAKTQAEVRQEQKDRQSAAEEYQQEIAEHTLSIAQAVTSMLDTVTSLNYDNFRSSLLDQIEELKKSIKFYTDGFDEKDFWHATKDYVSGFATNNIGGVNDVVLRLTNAGFLTYDQAQSLFDSAEAGAHGLTGFNGFMDSLNSWMRGDGWQSTSFNIDMYNKLIAEGVANIINGQAYDFARQNQYWIDRMTDLYASGSFSSLDYFNVEQGSFKNQEAQLEFWIKWFETIGGHDEEVEELRKQLAMLRHEMSESVIDMAEGFFGTNLESVIDNWLSLFQEFGDNIDAVFSGIDDGIDDMIQHMYQQILFVEPLLTRLREAVSSVAPSGFDEDGNAIYTPEDFEQMARNIGEAKEDAALYYQQLKDALAAVGIDIDSIVGDASTLTGSIQNVSEETAGIIAGRMNAIVINQAEATSVLRQSLLAQVEIRNNTSMIADDVRFIRQHIGSTARPNPNLSLGFTE